MDVMSQSTVQSLGSHSADSKKIDKTDSKSSKRKAPAPPNKPNKLKPQFSSQIHLDPNKSYPGSSSSGSWSGSSSGFSPSSDSFTSSSLSVGTGNGVDAITVRNVSENDISKVLKLSETSTENRNIANTQNRTSKESLANGKKQENLSETKSTEFEDKDHTNLSGYVENALKASATSLSDCSTRASKTHIPPRLLSFESSSTIDQDGLKTKDELENSQNLATEVRLDYVSLDYVRSAAAERRHRRKDKDDDENTLRSTSSLSSSFISSIDSDGGSTIGSDIVENLYNRITAATAKHKPQSKSVSSGDIRSDLYPRVFPGHRSKSEEILTEKPELQLTTDERTSAEKVNEFLQRNFNGNNNIKSTADEKSHNIDPFDVFHNGKQGIKKCPVCLGVTETPAENMSKAMSKAIDFLGKCMCNATNMDPPENITDIDYCNSNLKEVPVDVWQYCATLLRLLLESNTITELPRELFTCQSLEYLSVSDNDITTIPSTLASLVNLKHLDISKNVIEDVPECIRCCKNLEILDASVNPIERLSEGFTQLMSLRELYMNDCFFDFLPANFGRMSQLKVLELRDNQLQILPKSMRRLVQLNRLDLGGNAFQEWPDVISKLLELRELWLDCNELNKIPTDVGDLTHLTYLDLSRNFLESIPSQVGQLDCMTDLLLSENSLTKLPDTIGFLHNLTILNLEFNQLTDIPDSIEKLTCLQELELSHNKITSLPSTIGNLKCLEAFLLDENEIQKIPNEIGKCLELKILQLSRNEITELPESLGNLSNLRVLNICQNHISNLPISMVKLAGLDALWISPNQSKPNVPLHTEIDTKTGRRVLTNVLFPQNDKGAQRSTKSLSILDDDDESYANDAADDADMEAVLNKVRGKTHVVFNLDAITYSDDVEFLVGEEDLDEEPAEEENDTMNELLNYDKEREEKIRPDLKEESILKKASNLKQNSDNFSVHVSDIVIPPSGLSVFSTNTTNQNETNFDDSRPQLKVANILKVKQNIEPEKVEESIDQKLGTIPAKNPPNTLNSLESNLSQIETSNSLEDLEEDDNIIPPRAGEMKAWTSSSNIPFDLCETIQPIDIGEPIVSEPVLKNNFVLEENNKSKSSTRPVKFKQIVADKYQADSSPECSNADTLLERLRQMHKPEVVQDADIPTKPKADLSSPVSSVENDAKRAKTNPVFGFENIPFMDSDEDNSTAVKDRKPHENVRLEETETVFKPSSKNVEVDTFTLSPNFGIEGKSSSVTSGESLPATDHDSGVGNDVESQESIPDESNNVVVKNSPKPVVVTSQNFDLKNTRYVDSSAIRRNNKGWLGVVRTEKTEEILPAPKRSPQKESTKNISPTPINKDTSRKDKSNYHIKPHYLDSTTVTYSHDYNQSKALKNQNKNNPNKVSENIKKFEKFFENDMLAPKSDLQSADTNYRSLPRPSKETTNTVSNMTPIPPNPNASTVVSPYKSSDNILNSSSEVPYSLTENEITFGNSGSDITFQIKPNQPTIQPLNDTHCKQKQHAIVTRRNSGRKSKFEEALAATKHKHFRDKLEKMMNDKSPTHVSSRRNSRSNLPNIPRITSPVPRALSPHGNSTPLEQLTAEDTYYDPNIGVPSAQIPRSLSFNNKLREKLNVPTSNAPVHTHGNPRVRNGPSKINANPFGRRGSSQRSSIRSSSGYEEDKSKDLSEPENKKSLEEQLGQLLLDSSPQIDNAAPKGFVPYVNSDLVKPNKVMMSPPPVNRTSDLFGSQKKPIPADWKHQLLRHLEKKRQEKDELNFVAGNKTLPNHIEGIFFNKNQEFRRNDNARRSLGQESIRARNNNMERSVTAPQIGLRPAPSDNFVRTGNTGQPKVGGKRSSGRYMRTRTPGPDMDRQSKQVDQIVRPKSAMDLPTSMPNVLSFEQSRYSDWDVNKVPPVEKSVKKNEFSPPSYEDHILRRSTTNKDKYNDYVNIENIDKMRASKQYQDKRLIEPNNEYYQQSNYPIRQTGSHESILNSKPEKIYQGTNFEPPAQPSPVIRSSNSHDSMLDNNPIPYHSNRYKQPHYGYPQYQDPNHGYYEPPPRANTNYGVIPPPTKRAPKIPPREKSTSKHRTPHHRDNYAVFPPPPMGFSDEYEGIPPLSPSLQRNNDKEDESVASAFRPYHQKQQQQHQQPHHNHNNHSRQQKTRYNHVNDQHYQPRNVIDHHRYHHQLDRGLSHQGRKSYNRHSEEYMPRNGHFNLMDDELSAESDPSLSGELQRHWRETEAGIELVTVTVRKNPTFGFHIMGGIDAGGNPYRPDDDGVFITYVAPNGAADGYVEPGDKILLVNGSDFVGISHKRAVDLLRNAGQVAVLVVERLIGRPV